MNQTYNLNLIPGKVPVTCHVKQYDTELRNLVFKLYAGDSTFTIPSNTTITVSGTKPDGNGFSYNVTNFSGNTVTVPMKTQMTPVAGDFPCQLSIANSGSIIATASFILAVEPSALSDDTPVSDTDLALFQELATQTQEEAASVAGSAAQITANTDAISTLNSNLASVVARFGSYINGKNIDDFGPNDGGMWLYERASTSGTFPQTDTYGTLIHIPGTSSNFGIQFCRSNNLARSSGILYVRFKASGTWGDWKQFTATAIG